MFGAHGASARRQLPIGTTSRSRRTRGGKVTIPGSETLPYLYNSNYLETQTQIPRVDTTPQGVETQPRWVITDWLGFMEPPRGESCPSGQRRGPAAPGEDNFPSPGQKPFHTSTTLTTRRRKGRSPGSIPPCSMWIPQPHRVIADWLGLMKPARGESFPLGQRRGPATPGGDRVLSPD